MPRTTVHIDASVLHELKRRQSESGGTLGQLVSELLARALAESRRDEPWGPLEWPSRDLGPRIDLEDKEAVARALDRR